ncbi:hypothetical protein B0A65_01330 [Flavobacterium frigidimaris]|uniref:Uncharacterized protein n=1 Tax=Flavobacterium frigidimaris TaxID=262320 RepID=A0ABX4BWK3_FLAFR|nr:hypothetical protein B0A65_01330 [Flavobacterium frigidimaris]
MLLHQNANVTFNEKTKGLETRMNWKNARYALEFTYDEGFEFEQMIPLANLTPKQQKFVLDKRCKKIYIFTLF